MEEKNNMGKGLKVLSCLFFAVALLLLASVAVAQGTPSIGISPSTKTVSQGETFTVDVIVDPNGTEIRGAQCDLSFDPDFVTVNSVEFGDLFATATQTFGSNGTIDNVNGVVDGIYNSVIVGPNVTTAGTLVTISLTASSTATGDTTIGLQNTIISDPQGMPIPDVIVTNGTVSIQTLPWDLNNNGQVDVGDLVIVGNHFGETGTPGWIQCDFNNNGQIDVGDLVIVGNHFGETI